MSPVSLNPTQNVPNPGFSQTYAVEALIRKPDVKVQLFLS